MESFSKMTGAAIKHAILRTGSLVLLLLFCLCSFSYSRSTVPERHSIATVKEREAVFLRADVTGGFAPYSYQWDLGDKTTSTEAAFSHTYNNDGKYTVTLTMTDDHGTKITKTRTDYITVIPGWSAGNIVRSAWDGLVAFGHAMANIFIWLGVFIPVWIVAGAIIIFLWWRRDKSRNRINY